MAEKLSEDRQRLIFRYMEGTAPSARARPDDPPPRPAFDRFEQAALPPARLDVLRRRAAAVLHRHPQLPLSFVLVVMAVTVGWLVAHA
jgi:hypothetical protein